jgi:hypothetical protein
MTYGAMFDRRSIGAHVKARSKARAAPTTIKMADASIESRKTARRAQYLIVICGAFGCG